jgi:hypothetical protein
MSTTPQKKVGTIGWRCQLSACGHFCASQGFLKCLQELFCPLQVRSPLPPKIAQQMKRHHFVFDQKKCNRSKFSVFEKRILIF